jgi:hypothetical protein
MTGGVEGLIYLLSIFVLCCTRDNFWGLRCLRDLSFLSFMFMHPLYSIQYTASPYVLRAAWPFAAGGVTTGPIAVCSARIAVNAQKSELAVAVTHHGPVVWPCSMQQNGGSSLCSVQCAGTRDACLDPKSSLTRRDPRPNECPDPRSTRARAWRQRPRLPAQKQLTEPPFCCMATLGGVVCCTTGP